LAVGHVDVIALSFLLTYSKVETMLRTGTWVMLQITNCYFFCQFAQKVMMT